MDEVLASIAEFATTLSYDSLPSEIVVASKVRLMDALGCAIAACDSEPAKIGRSLAPPPARDDLAGCIVGWNDIAAADAAAFVNTSMIRYLDLNDSFPGVHCSDCLGGLLAVAPQIGASGQRLIAATVVAYETIMRLVPTKIRTLGWDAGFGIGVGLAAGLANLMGLSRAVAEHAIAITAVGNMQMRNTRAGQLSMWKGSATAYAVRNAVFAVQLAAAGMTGPEAPFTGRHGFVELITGPFDFPPVASPLPEFFMLRTGIKYWPVAGSLQALPWAALELREQIAFDELVSLEVHTYRNSWSESGSEPAKWDPTSRETADHSIPYILAWVLRNGEIDERTFVPESYLDPSLRPIMSKIAVTIDDEIENEFQRTRLRGIRVTAKDRSGKRYEAVVLNPLGNPKNPMSPKELMGKVERLCEPWLGKERTARALEQWQRIESVPNSKSAFDALQVAALGAKDATAARKGTKTQST